MNPKDTHLAACRTALRNHFYQCTQCNTLEGDVDPLTTPPCDVGLACFEELVIAEQMVTAEHEAAA